LNRHVGMGRCGETDEQPRPKADRLDATGHGGVEPGRRRVVARGRLDQHLLERRERPPLPIPQPGNSGGAAIDHRRRIALTIKLEQVLLGIEVPARIDLGPKGLERRGVARRALLRSPWQLRDIQLQGVHIAEGPCPPGGSQELGPQPPQLPLGHPLVDPIAEIPVSGLSQRHAEDRRPQKRELCPLDPPFLWRSNARFLCKLPAQLRSQRIPAGHSGPPIIGRGRLLGSTHGSLQAGFTTKRAAKQSRQSWGDGMDASHPELVELEREASGS